MIRLLADTVIPPLAIVKGALWLSHSSQPPIPNPQSPIPNPHAII